MRVPLRRLVAWVDGFGARHGGWTSAALGEDAGWRLTGGDGASAEVHAPAFLDVGPGSGFDPGAVASIRPRFGVLLIRRAGYAVALALGTEILASKVSSRHIHGRTAAGGWSQQRYARRRSNQADEIAGAAAAAADRLLVADAEGARPEFLVTGGDRPLLRAVLEGLSPAVAALPVVEHVAVGAPTAEVLHAVPDRVLSLEVVVTDATADAGRPAPG